MDQNDETKIKDKTASLSPFDEIETLQDYLPEPGPAMRVLAGLDPSSHGEPAKQAQAGNYISLTNPVQLTTLAPAAELTSRLANLEARMPNFAPVIQTLIGDFALARRGAAQRPS